MTRLSAIKSRFVRAGEHPHTVLTGLLAGTRLQLDLRSQMQIWLGLWERELNLSFRTLSRDAATFLDVGAGEGFYSVFGLRRTAIPRVLAFEPLEGRCERIQKNLHLNGYERDPRIEIRDLFVGTADPPRSVTLDEIAVGLVDPCLVKIDIEGGEACALSHASSLLARPTRWIVEVHSAQLERECLEIFRNWGYEVRIVSPAWWRRVVAENRWMEGNRWIIATPNSDG